MIFIFSFILIRSVSSDSSHKPVIILPGLMASLLHGNITRRPYWYCSTFQDTDIWVNDIFGVPPLYNCIFDYIGLRWDNETQQVTQKEGVSLEPVDFGGLSGMTYVDFVSDIHVIPVYGPLVESLSSIGYVERESMFGIPYDWRFGMHQPDSLWENTKKLVEEAYTKNGNQKVVFVAHSMGSIFVNHFCMTKMTKEWRDKYIDSAVLLAPSLGGSFLSFYVMWSKMFPFLSILGEIPDSAPKIGGINIHMPNFEIFGNKVLYTDENGNQYTARDLKNILQANGKFDDIDVQKIFEMNENFAHNIPPPFDFPISIVYNDALGTLLSLDRSTKEEVYSYGKGDFLVNAEGIEFLCNKWNTTYKVDCFNLEHVVPTANHLSIIWQNETINFIIDHINNNKWKKPRK